MKLFFRKVMGGHLLFDHQCLCGGVWTSTDRRCLYRGPQLLALAWEAAWTHLRNLGLKSRDSVLGSFFCVLLQYVIFRQVP